MPDFTIIAGPNGAGKSTFSTILSSLDAIIFDADKVQAKKEKQYPDVPIERIQMMIDSAYWEAEEIAIKDERDLTVESNLRNDFLINRAFFFKNKGYSINLIYMLLPDIEISTERVGLRVAQKGHFIDPASIRYNFEQGLTIFKEHFYKFDNVKVLNSTLDLEDSGLKTILIIKNNQISFIDTKAPIWAKPVLDELVEKLSIN